MSYDSCMDKFKFFIREAIAGDVQAIIAAHLASIRELCSKDYSHSEIAAWTGYAYSPDHWIQNIMRDNVWVVTDNQRNIFGFGHLRFESANRAEIEGLYLMELAAGIGIGRRLIDIILKECRKKSIVEVVLTSTRNSTDFYQHFGFQKTGKKVYVPRGNEKIECFEMVLSIG